MNLSINDFQARRNWPNLKPENFTRTSPDTIDYNCAAWAAGDTERWWWPAPDDPEAYWPDAVAKTSTLDAFEAAYATLGYEKCEASELEPGFERVAVYAPNGKPLHVARQLPSGHWTSKLGNLEDIEHSSLEDLEGPFYGYPELFLRKVRPSPL